MGHFSIADAMSARRSRRLWAESGTTSVDHFKCESGRRNNRQILFGSGSQSLPMTGLRRGLAYAGTPRWSKSAAADGPGPGARGNDRAGRSAGEEDNRFLNIRIQNRMSLRLQGSPAPAFRPRVRGIGGWRAAFPPRRNERSVKRLKRREMAKTRASPRLRLSGKSPSK